jgi:Skp family chaperone for outer membrane proteins
MDGSQYLRAREVFLVYLREAEAGGPLWAQINFSHFVRSFTHRMNRTLVIATALATGLATSSLFAQAASSAHAHTAATHEEHAAAEAPEAIPAKVAVIAFEQVAGGTNEGQKIVADLRGKYEARNSQLQNQASQIDSLKKQLQALPATTSDEDRAKRVKDIDIQDHKLQSDAQELQQEEQADFQDAFGKLMQKVGPVAVKYASEHGFTLLLNTASSQGELPTLLWWNSKTDISAAVVEEYNKESGVAAPTPSAPTPHRSTTPRK